MSPPKSPVDLRNSASITAGPASPNPLAEAGANVGPSGMTRAESVPEGLPDIAPVASNSELDPASLIGRVLGGRYRLQGILGRGAMGVVYRGIQVALTKPYAIKVLLPSLTRDPQFDARFKQEARIAAAIRHPGLVEVFDYGFEGGIAYYVMELLEGRNLAEHLRSSAPLSPKDAVRIVASAADAVSAAHDKGVIHRDLKPANLFLARDSAGQEVVKVLDFGVSKAAVPDNLASPMLSASGFICGTPAYMSPEQAAGRSIDGRSDIYSLGIVLYRLLAGQLPFDAPQSVVVMCMHLEREPPPIPTRKGANGAVPLALETALFRALAKRPEDRFATAREFASALRAAVAGEPSSTRPLPALSPEPMVQRTQILQRPFSDTEPAHAPTAPKARMPRERQRKWMVGAAALSGLGALGAVLVFAQGSRKPPALPAPASNPSPSREARAAPAPAASPVVPRLSPALPQVDAVPAPVPTASPEPPAPEPPRRVAPELPSHPAPPLKLPRPPPPRPYAKATLVLTSKAPGAVRVLVAGTERELRLNLPQRLEVPAGRNRVTFIPESGKPCTVSLLVPEGEQGALVFGPETDAVESLASSRRWRLSCQKSL
jgi:serine/threonine protein kinase